MSDAAKHDELVRMLGQIDDNAMRMAALDRTARANLIAKGAGSLDAALAAATSQIDCAARAIPEVEAETRRLARMN